MDGVDVSTRMSKMCKCTVMWWSTIKIQFQVHESLAIDEKSLLC